MHGDYSKLRDEQLLERLQSGDGWAMEQLYLRHSEHIFSFIYDLTGNQQTAEDVMQECFKVLYQKPNGFNPNRGTRFEDYLLGIAKNTLYMEFRKCRKQGVLNEEDLENKLTDHGDPAEDLYNAQIQTLVWQKLLELPLKYREVLNLSIQKDLDIQRIAQILELNVATVRTRLFRGRQEARKLLAPLFLKLGRKVNSED